MGESEQTAQPRTRGLLSLPSTRSGVWSARLLFLSFVLVLLDTLLVMPVTEQEVGLELVQRAYNAISGLAVVSAGLSGLYALVAKRERSWVAFVSTLVFAAVMVMMVQDLMVAG